MLRAEHRYFFLCTSYEHRSDPLPPHVQCSFEKISEITDGPLGEIQGNVNGFNCTKSYVLCEARCCLCNVTYIGATARAFHTRARARFYNVRRQDREESALADHFVALHPKNIANPAIDFKALGGLIELTIANLSKNGAVLA